MELLVLWVVMGVVVGIVAASKGRNFLLWAIYGFLIWPVALVHAIVLAKTAQQQASDALQAQIGMVQAGSHKACPKCAEMVKAAATVCRFCGHDFDNPDGPAKTLPVIAESVEG